MVDLWLVSALVEKGSQIIGHRASVERAGSMKEAEDAHKTKSEVDGYVVTSIDTRKLELGWYR